MYFISAGEITANQDLNLHKTTPYEVYVTVNDGHRSTGPETLTVKLTGIYKADWLIDWLMFNSNLIV